MRSRLLLVAAFLVLATVMMLMSCDGEPSGSPSESSTTTTASGSGSNDVFGHGIAADIGIYLRPEIDDNEMTALMSALLFETKPGREGEAMIDGVNGVQGDYGVKGIYVDFEVDASEERISEIIREVSASPDVIEVRREAIVGE